MVRKYDVKRYRRLVEEKQGRCDESGLWKGRNRKLKVGQKECLDSDGEVEKIKGRNKTDSLVGGRRRRRKEEERRRRKKEKKKKRRIREEIEVRRGIKEVDIAYSAITTFKHMPDFRLACKTEM